MTLLSPIYPKIDTVTLLFQAAGLYKKIDIKYSLIARAIDSVNSCLPSKKKNNRGL